MFLKILIVTTFLSLLFKWLFIIHWEVFTFKTEVFDVWIPIILPWIPLFIWLRKRVRLVSFSKGGDAPTLLMIIAWVVIGALMYFSNIFLDDKNSNLIEANFVHELKIDDKGFAKVENLDVDIEKVSVYKEFSTSGKYRRKFNIDIFFTFKIATNQNRQKLTYWFVKKYHKQIQSSLSSKEKDAIYKEFFNESFLDINALAFSFPNYYKITPHSNDKDAFLKAIDKMDYLGDHIPIILEPQEGVYEDKDVVTFNWLLIVFFGGMLLFYLVLYFAKLNKRDYVLQLRGEKSRGDEAMEFLHYLIPKNEHFITAIFVDICFLVYILMFFYGVNPFYPHVSDLMEWGANRRYETLNGEWWRLLTSNVLHLGPMHLLLNTVVLIPAGLYIEEKLGRFRMTLLIILTGIGASLASIYWYENSVSVGASGVAFGLIGVVFGLTMTKSIKAEYKASIIVLLGGYVILSFIVGWFGDMDNAAHAGGLITGMISGLILYLIHPNHKAS